jgi:malonyl CoA-acyl carrier protein transacylase
VFSGQGSQYRSLGKELCEDFPSIRKAINGLSGPAEFDLAEFLFESDEEGLRDTRRLQPALFAFELALAEHAASVGMKPTAMAGHSLGELAALCAAGAFTPDDGIRLVRRRAECMHRWGVAQSAGTGMLAVLAPWRRIEANIQAKADLHVANRNSPSQTVVGGPIPSLDALSRELERAGVRTVSLRVPMAFHAPGLRAFRRELEEFLSSIPVAAPQTPVISNLTGRLYPNEPEAIRQAILDQMESPVQWESCVRALSRDWSVFRFLEIGPGRTLCGLIEDTLADAVCVPSCLPSKESETAASAAAKLFAEGCFEPRQEVAKVDLVALELPNDRPGSALQVRLSGARLEEIRATIRTETQAFFSAPLSRALERHLLQTVRLEHDSRMSEQELGQILSSMRLDLGVGAGQPVSGLDKSAAGAECNGALLLAGAKDASSAPPSTTQRNQPEPSQPGGVGQPSLPGERVVVPALGEVNLVDELISIIAEVTGYEPREIGPDMDLRQELAIRSSRFPIILDAAERRFGFQIEFDDFLGVRTVREAAARLEEKRTRGDSLAPRTHVRGGEARAAQGGAQPFEGHSKKPIRRMVFEDRALEMVRFDPIELATDDRVMLLTPDRRNRLSRALEAVFKDQYGVSPTPVGFLRQARSRKPTDFDLLLDDEAALAGEYLRSGLAPTGMVVVLDETIERRVRGMEAVSCLLTGLFRLIQTFLQLPSRKFVLLMKCGASPDGTGRLLTEGMLAVFLSAALEYGSVQFRTLELDQDTDLAYAVRCALDRSRPVIETRYRSGEAFSTGLRVTPNLSTRGHAVRLRPGDVVVISGGGRGVTSHLARALAPFGCRLVLLGRTKPTWEVASEGMTPGADGAPPNPDPAEIRSVLQELETVGVEASYFTCDVVDAQAVEVVFKEISSRYGRIDGIIHGAGFLRNGLLQDLSPCDFSGVLGVKCLGARNLLRAGSPRGLRFFAALSTVSAVTGNLGQANYAAANRVMHAWLEQTSGAAKHLTVKTLFLPPIAGTGMADTAETREFMRRIGLSASYVDLDELRELFLRELLAPEDDSRAVMFARELPKIETALVNLPSADASTARADRSDDGFPLIEQACQIATGSIRAERTFSRKRDVWLEDHRPFRSHANPLFSAVMMLEAAAEVARVLFPYLSVKAVRDVRFLDIIEFPPEVDRRLIISCDRLAWEGRDLVCGVKLATQGVDASEDGLAKSAADFVGRVILTGQPGGPLTEFPGFPLSADDLDSPPLTRAELQGVYDQKTALGGRYRVLTSLETGPEVARGRTTLAETRDMTDGEITRYQLCPYLLEAVQHTAVFSLFIRSESEERAILPVAVEEVAFGRQPECGAEIVIQTRLQKRSREGVVWDAECRDLEGHVAVQVRGLRMRWLGA